MSTEPSEPQLALQGEPVAIISLVVIALNAIQTAALSIPTVAHVVIACVIVGLGAVLQRSKVTPVTTS